MRMREPVLDESEGRFLAYLACRINCEVDRFQREEQCAQIRLLADRALQILGSRDELDAWLEAATRVTELTRASAFRSEASVGQTPSTTMDR